MGRFSTEDPIFESQEPLRDHYSPDQLQEREDKLDELAVALQPVMKQEAPENVLVYGSQGAGKTVSVNHILRELEDEVREAHDEKLTTVNIQCRQLTSTYQLVIKIINDLREQREEDVETFSETGHPKQTVYRKLYDELDKAGDYVILVLDEFDEIEKDRDEFLRNVSRALAEGNVTETKPGIITISNGYRFVESLDPETKDSLDAEEIIFNQYDADELRSILETRGERAFKPDVVGEHVLPKCAAIAARSMGSAREACQLLRKAGKIARDEDPGAESVQKNHVEKAKKELENERIIAGLRDLDPHAHLAVLALIGESDLLEDSNPSDTRVTTRKVYKRYTRFVDSNGDEPLSKRRFKDRLDSLSRKGYVEQTKTHMGGHSSLHKLDVDIETVVSALEKSNEADIRKRAERLRKDAEEKSLISA